MIPYASRTGTRRNLAALRAARWRLIVSARGVHRSEGMQYAIDNGAWTAHTKGEPFDARSFVRCCDRLSAGADFIVCPDIVAGGLRSLEFSMRWLPRVRGWDRPVLLAVQDGMTPDHVRSLVGPSLGLFVGGSTDWKLSTLKQWGRLARIVGCWLHIGRVNTARRIHLCHDAGAHSFDGSSATRWQKNLRKLDQANKQGRLWDDFAD